ncbi:MAG: SsrA-binding protein SmpB [Patescibacteria group bacterium]|nr:SsrA-binding protein SmpB [Patescibacteria group bacterium]
MSLVVNRKARSLYQIEDTFLAGLVLSGPEVKSLRQAHASLVGSFVRIINGEAFLINAQISPYVFAINTEYDARRIRKLLLKKAELDRLTVITTQQKRVLVPLSFELDHRRIKLKVGIGRGKKQYEQRETIKRRQQKREMAKEFKTQLKGF